MSEQKKDDHIRVDVRKEESFLNNIYESAGMHPYHKLLLYCGEVYAACRINSWCFDTSSGRIINAFSAHEESLAEFFSEGQCLSFCLQNYPCHYPFILSDEMGMVWIAAFSPIHESQESNLLFVLGPVFTSKTSPAVIRDHLDRKNYPFQVRKQIELILADVPVLSASSVEQYAKMLHFALTGEPCDAASFRLQSSEQAINPYLEPDEESYESLRKDGIPLDRLMDNEAALLHMVREGRKNDELLSQLRSRNNVTEYTEGDPLRNTKDTLIILCDKYMMTAEEAGLPVRISRTAGLKYVREIEASRSLTELSRLEKKMTDDFIGRVREIKSTLGFSPDVRIAMDYIRSNLTRPITIEEVASHVGYSGYYLSRKFAKETGEKFADFVNRERIEYAKTLLRITNLPIQSISDTLQFSSLSYFGRVFRKITGMSPKAFRDGKGS